MQTITTDSKAELRIKLALSSDGPALQELQRRCTHSASFDVEKFNYPDFFGRAQVYETSRVFTAHLGGKLVGSIAAGIRQLSLNKSIQTVGYIFQLFVAPETQGLGIARRLYETDIAFFKEQSCSAAYMIVADGNQSCVRLIEKAGAYRARPLTMASLPVYRTMKPLASIRPFTPADAEAVAALSNKTWAGHQMYEPQSKERLLRDLEHVPGCGIDSLFVLEEGGVIRACAGFWDASQIERVIMRSLSLRLRATSFALDTLRLLREAPRVPKPGETLAQWLLQPIGWERIDQLHSLFCALNNHAQQKKIGQMFLLCEAKHPGLEALDGFFRVDVGLGLFIHPLSANSRLESGPLYVAPTDQ